MALSYYVCFPLSRWVGMSASGEGFQNRSDMFVQVIELTVWARLFCACFYWQRTRNRFVVGSFGEPEMQTVRTRDDTFSVVRVLHLFHIRARKNYDSEHEDKVTVRDIAHTARQPICHSFGQIHPSQTRSCTSVPPRPCDPSSDTW